MIARDLLDLGHPRRLHLLGVAGSGMSPLARMLLAQGHDVSGADAHESDEVDRLRRAGVPVLTTTEAALLPSGVEGVIHSAAVPPDAPPIARARAEGIPVVKYAQAVGLLSREMRTCAVAGTHGKTTTTALLAYVMRTAGADPSYLVGGTVPQLPVPGFGRSEFFVAEACEYDRSFLHLSPEVAIITNIEADHLDYFRDIVEICAVFRTFATQVDELMVIHESLRETIGRAGGVRARVLTFGSSPDADLRILPAERSGFFVGSREYRLSMPGYHNMLNAAAVLLVARELGLEDGAVQRALADFQGVGRRLQVIGRPRGVSVVDDYAHHPTEVAAGIKALRDEYAPRRLWCVFQPHQYSRLRRFLKEFAHALTGADRIVVPEIFAARDREEDRRSVTAGDLVEEVRTLGGDAVHIPDFTAIVDFVRTQARPGDLVVTMGAGDVGSVAGRLAEAL
ncbi:MAG: UDP-N-acetylmuramate--L-alanine ligase [Planctomycetota bacterium]|jgi:UDP-N-acetylmuramate--alanine ligase